MQLQPRNRPGIVSDVDDDDDEVDDDDDADDIDDDVDGGVGDVDDDDADDEVDDDVDDGVDDDVVDDDVEASKQACVFVHLFSLITRTLKHFSHTIARRTCSAILESTKSVCPTWTTLCVSACERIPSQDHLLPCELQLATQHSYKHGS